MSNSHTSPRQPVVFEEFFELGLEETASPFIFQSSRYLSANLTLKAACLATILLTIAFFLQFYPPLLPFSHILLIFVYFLAGYSCSDRIN